MKLGYRKMSVLLVDSVTMCTDTLGSYLKDFQFYRTWTAASAEEAMRILQKNPVQLLVTAWKMMPVSGFQLVENARKNGKLKDLIIFMMMDRKDKHVLEKGEALKVDGYINLPLEAKAVRAKVEEALDPLIDEDQEEFDMQMHLARVHMRKGDIEEAEKAFKAAIAVKSEEESFLGLGKLMKQKGNLREAERCFMAALKLNVKSLKAFMGLAEVYEMSGRLQDALKVLAAAANAAKNLKEEGETRAGILFYMGEVELKLKDLQKALGLFREAEEASGGDGQMQTKIGDALADNGNYGEAEEFYKRALEADPELAHVYNRLGISYRKQAKFDLAINLYRKAMTFHPNDEHLLYNIARTYWDMDELQLASEILTNALKINPEFREAKILLDASLNKLGFQVSRDGNVPGPGD